MKNTIKLPPGKIGQSAEQLAITYLKKQNCKLYHQNFRCKAGEIDLIVQDGNSLVFVEVRYRRQENFGTAAETVNHTKQAKLIKTAQWYLLHQKRDPQTVCRFDVISVTGDLEQDPQIQWIKNAFSVM